MNRYKITIAYEGTAYCGWQRQLNGISIQEKIETALATLLRAPTSLQGSGRTDAGVHALGQVAHFDTLKPLNPPSFLFSLNALLPKDIRICALEPISSAFHARYSVRSKIYHYYFLIDPIGTPFFSHFQYHVPHRVNRDLLQTAIPLFVGTHDFTSFSHEAHAGSAARDPIRTIYQITLTESPWGGLCLAFEGEGFLYKMVRNIVGTLLDISRKKIALEEIPLIFAAKDRRRAGRTAPPHGLFLIHVNYENSGRLQEKKITGY